MTNIPGNKNILVDSDALIGLIHEDDLLHRSCMKINNFIAENSFIPHIPYPIVLEAATALAKDKTIKRPDLAAKLLNDYVLIDQKILLNDQIPQLVSKLYNPKTSKKNSPFDYYLLALSKRNNISIIFSFDEFYKKNGLTLMIELLQIPRL